MKKEKLRIVFEKPYRPYGKIVVYTEQGYTKQYKRVFKKPFPALNYAAVLSERFNAPIIERVNKIESFW